VSKAKNITVSIGLFASIFVSSIGVSIFSVMYLIDKVEDKYRVHDSLIQNERDQHSQYSLYASYALAFKGDANKNDYGAILERACSILVISKSKMNPELFKGANRYNDEVVIFDQTIQAIGQLKSAGYCSDNFEEQGYK